MRLIFVVICLTAAFVFSTAAQASTLTPAIVPPITLPGVTVTVSGPTITLPARTVTVPGPIVTAPAQTKTVTNTTTQTVTIPAKPAPMTTNDIPPVTVTETQTQRDSSEVRKTVTVTAGQQSSVSGTLVTPTHTVTSPGKDRIVKTTVPKAAGISVGLIILGALVMLGALAIMYRLGFDEGTGQVAKSLRAIIDQARKR